MIYAINEQGERVKATPKAEASCPMCASPLLAKCGSTVTWHWAHCSLKDCDEWSEGETPWHSSWKSRFARSEVTITHDGRSHRADVVSHCGKVIEFQHSTISADEIAEREQFYGDMVWVLDATHSYASSRIGLTHRIPESGDPYFTFKWSRRKTSFDAATKPVFLDLGVASCDIGETFRKDRPWWDDAVLRDGCRREAGLWKRTVIGPLLLEIKKKTEGFGWGRLVSRDEFCRRHGGEDNDYWSFAGVRRDDFFFDSDGYVPWSFASSDFSVRARLSDMNQKGVTS
jgi:hypothetical protein